VSKMFQIRTCVGCGNRAAQADLMRFGVGRDDVVAPDRDGRLPGRGAYLHRNEACWDRFVARKGTVRSLKRPLSRAQRQDLVARLQKDSEL